MVLKLLADLVRDGQYALALAAIVLPLGILLFARARDWVRRTTRVSGAEAAEGAAVFRLLSEFDQTRIASLAASGNAIGAIKALRKLVDIDLRTAKNAVETLAEPTADRPGPISR